MRVAMYIILLFTCMHNAYIYIYIMHAIFMNNTHSCV